ncbi:MAG: alpha-E domain-containing protein [Caldimonas sp.]
MLSRTADHLYWMARYMERAENTARMLDVNYQMSLLPQSDGAAERGWRGLLSISELTGDFAKRHGEVTPKSVMDYMVSDPDNDSSIRSCLMAARENARAVRGTLTTEVWETQNQTWLEFQRMVATDAFQRSPGEAFEWVKFRSHLSRGVTVGTMLQDQAFHFLRIGSFLERSDNTARLLDVKFHAVDSEFFGFGSATGFRRDRLAGMRQSQSQDGADAPPAPAQVEGTGKDVEFDFYHWSAVLRSVSGFEVYRKVYRNVIRPERVAELLILRPDMPRSLAACMHEVVSNLHRVANEQSKDTLRLAGRLDADLQYGRIDEILATGLHAYLTQFLERVNALGAGISRDFLVPVAA